MTEFLEYCWYKPRNNVYSFNATTAKEACEAIKMRIAQKAEVETANKNGFQTCR